MPRNIRKQILSEPQFWEKFCLLERTALEFSDVKKGSTKFRINPKLACVWFDNNVNAKEQSQQLLSVDSWRNLHTSHRTSASTKTAHTNIF